MKNACRSLAVVALLALVSTARYDSPAPWHGVVNPGDAITGGSSNTRVGSSPRQSMLTSGSSMHRGRGAPVSDVTREAPKLLLKCAESDGGKTNEERMPQPGRRGTAVAGRHGHGGDPEDGTRNGAQAGRSHHAADRDHRRSEEHTSELQSLMRISYAVFCLKKKKKHNRQSQIN